MYLSHIRTMGGWQWKAVCTGTPFTVEKISPPAGFEPGSLDILINVIFCTYIRTERLRIFVIIS